MEKRILIFLMKRWRLFLAVAVIVIIIASVGMYLQKRAKALQVMEAEISAAEGLEYEVCQETPDSSWVVVKVSAIPSETQLKAIAFLVWETTKTPNVFLYLSETKLSGAAYAVAKFVPQGLKGFRINPLALRGTKWEERIRR